MPIRLDSEAEGYNPILEIAEQLRTLGYLSPHGWALKGEHEAEIDLIDIDMRKQFRTIQQILTENNISAQLQESFLYWLASQQVYQYGLTQENAQFVFNVLPKELSHKIKQKVQDDGLDIDVTDHEFYLLAKLKEIALRHKVDLSKTHFRRTAGKALAPRNFSEMAEIFTIIEATPEEQAELMSDLSLIPGFNMGNPLPHSVRFIDSVAYFIAAGNWHQQQDPATADYTHINSAFGKGSTGIGKPVVREDGEPAYLKRGVLYPDEEYDNQPDSRYHTYALEKWRYEEEVKELSVQNMLMGSTTVETAEKGIESYIVMVKAGEHELTDHLYQELAEKSGSVVERRADSMIATGIIANLAHQQRMNRVNRDIKCQNFMIDSKTLCIWMIDHGASVNGVTHEDDTEIHDEIRTTAGYMAPSMVTYTCQQVREGNYNETSYDFTTDNFAGAISILRTTMSHDAEMKRLLKELDQKQCDFQNCGVYSSKEDLEFFSTENNMTPEEVLDYYQGKIKNIVGKIIERLIEKSNFDATITALIVKMLQEEAVMLSADLMPEGELRQHFEAHTAMLETKVKVSTGAKDVHIEKQEPVEVPSLVVTVKKSTDVPVPSSAEKSLSSPGQHPSLTNMSPIKRKSGPLAVRDHSQVKQNKPKGSP